MNSDANSLPTARQMEETFTAGLKQMMGGFAWASPLGLAAMPPGFPKMDGSTFEHSDTRLSFNAAQLQTIQQRYVADASVLWNQSVQAGAAVPTEISVAVDRRFAAQAWNDNPVARFSAASYLLNARTLMSMAEAVEGDEKTKSRLRFAVEQWMAASAPSNFMALNVDAQKKAI